MVQLHRQPVHYTKHARMNCILSETGVRNVLFAQGYSRKRYVFRLDVK